MVSQIPIVNVLGLRWGEESMAKACAAAAEGGLTVVVFGIAAKRVGRLQTLPELAKIDAAR
jgi:hypothetical protein